MNIPKRTIMKIMLIPLNFTLEKRYPFIDPTKQEIIVAGMTRRKLFARFGPSFVNALKNPSKDHFEGSRQTVEGLISVIFLKLVVRTI